MSRLVAMVLCNRKHGKAYEVKPSCAIYTASKNQYRTYCFGCHAVEFITEHQKQELISKSKATVLNTKPKPTTTIPPTTNQYSEDAIKFLDSRKIDVVLARSYGVRQIMGESALWLPIREIDGKQGTGGIIRRYDSRNPKVKLVPSTSNVYPKGCFIEYEAHYYTRTHANNIPTIFLVESIIDGLAILSIAYSLRNVCAYAMLGTHISRENKLDIYRIATKYPDASLTIAFDPDSAGEKGFMELQTQLATYYPTKVNKMQVKKKPYDYTLTDIRGAQHP